MDQEMVVPCPKCVFASDSKVVGKHIRMFHSNRKLQNCTVSILGGMKQFRSDIINFTCLKCHFTDTLYYNMKKHVLMNHFQNLISMYFGQRPDDIEEHFIEHYCKKCNAIANSQDTLMYHVLTSDAHRDLENKLRSLISEHLKKPGLVKQMHIAPKPPTSTAAPSLIPTTAPSSTVTTPTCIQLAFPQNNQNQTMVQGKAVQNTVRPLAASNASSSLTHTSAAPVVTPPHVTLVSSPLPVAQNVSLQPPVPQPVFVSHRVPLNQPVRPGVLPLAQPVGTISRPVAPGVLPLNQPVRPGLLPVNQPIGTINSLVAPGALPVAQPVGSVNRHVGPGVHPATRPLAPGVVPLNHPMGNINQSIGPGVLPVPQAVTSGVLQFNQPVTSGVLPVNQPVRPGVSQNTAFLTTGPILRQLIPTGKQVNGIPTYTLAPVSVTLPVSPGGGVATVTPPQMPIQLMPSGTVTQVSHSPASAPSPPIVVTSSHSMSAQASPPAPETSQALKQAKQWKTCPVCNELFPSNVYQVHMEVAHKHNAVKTEETLEPDKLAVCAPFLRWMREKTVRCLSCKCFLSEEELIKHLLMHGLACLFCTYIFHDLKSLVEHNKTVHNGKKKLHEDYSNRGFQLDNDADGDLTFPHFEFSTMLPKEELSEKEVHLAVLAGVNSRTLVPVYIKVKPQTAEVNSICNNKKVFTCPFCFGTFINKETYEVHLKERHHIMPTVHTILKSPAFKCIHCCGVYTGNMTLTAIAVHLLRCRSAPKDSNSSIKMPLERNEKKELSLVNGEKHDSVCQSAKRKQSDICSIVEDQRNKEQQLQSLGTGTALAPNKDVNLGVVPVKRQKVESRTEMKGPPSAEDLRILALDPKQYEHSSYETRKQFLADYFHKRPYPTKKEMELLSSVLCMWKLDVASFFGKKRHVCLKAIKNRQPSVLLGFSMSELKNVKHSVNLKYKSQDV
ncbi:activity-dependent neuroprotector homeobox protein 2 isoform X2 [Pelodiscus sinensis]|nr:activity-dependent neuroprotector homeobox protein 2 isoform X3 [Pelodiscus sinensis]|eukprot:XP_006134069.1 activity-dependent neuroprotector homeobox protein 2 isoform X3 [Pelodiscus sinensis]